MDLCDYFHQAEVTEVVSELFLSDLAHIIVAYATGQRTSLYHLAHHKKLEVVSASAGTLLECLRSQQVEFFEVYKVRLYHKILTFTKPEVICHFKKLGDTTVYREAPLLDPYVSILADEISVCTDDDISMQLVDSNQYVDTEIKTKRQMRFTKTTYLTLL